MGLLNKLGAGKLGVIAGSAIVVLAVFTYLIFKMSAGVFAPLYSNLSVEDAGVIAVRLQAMGISYNVSTDGTEISVPSDKVLTLRMMFAEEGIPSSGNIVGYEIFDREDILGTSQFVYNVNLIRALEGELVRTISTLNQVENVRVHIVLPKRELFSHSGTTPSASVVLKMRGNLRLSKSEVTGIANLVATAVPGLTVEHITILDSSGKPLMLGGEDDSLATSASTSIELQRNVEKRIKQEIEEMVSRLVGPDKVVVSVTADMNMDREVISSETYDPSGQVLRSSKTSSDDETDTEPAHTVSVATNLPGASGQTTPGGSKKISKSDEIMNYEISKTVSNKVVENAKIQSLSIAVLVDGSYNIDPKTNQSVYTPRTQQELDQIKSLVISGLGVNLSRGDQIDVINMPFISEGMDTPSQGGILGFLKDDLQNIIQTIVIGVVLTLLVLLVIRPLVLRSLEATKSATGAVEQNMLNNLQQEVKAQSAPMPTAATPPQDRRVSPTAMMAQASIGSLPVDEERKASMVKEFNDLVDTHPEETVSMIKNWLYQE